MILYLLSQYLDDKKYVNKPDMSSNRCRANVMFLTLLTAVGFGSSMSSKNIKILK